METEHETPSWKRSPDFVPCADFIETLTEVSTNGDPFVHQYTRGCGHPKLVSVLSKIYSKLTQQEIDADNGVVTSTGSYAVMHHIIMSYIKEGDEIIIVEPFSDFYEGLIRSAEGLPIFVPLRLKFHEEESSNRASDVWALDHTELEMLFNQKTKIILIDNPNTHLGKVYTKQELQFIANLCQKWNVMCVSIETDEFLVYKSHDIRYTRMMELPDMYKRTVTVGSAKSTYFMDGWEISWAYGPPYLINNIQLCHLNSVFGCSTVLQETIAIVLEKELERLHTKTSYLDNVGKQLSVKKQSMLDGLIEIGLKTIIPDSGTFITACWSHLEDQIKTKLGTKELEDLEFAKWLEKNSGADVVPLAMFFTDQHKYVAKNIVRFCFNKKEETLNECKRSLKKLL